MVWHSEFPLGTVSVKQNKTIGLDNTQYIEITMGNSVVGTNTASTRDHFWNVGSNQDGRHRFMQSEGFTVGSVPADPVLGTGMDTVIYAKETNGQVQWFNRNINGIYQFIPTVLTGSVVIPSTTAYTALVAVPANVYGSIFAYTAALSSISTQIGFFRSDNTHVEAWSSLFRIDTTTDPSFAIKFANGASSSGLDIRAVRSTAIASQSWNYIVKYRAL